MWGEDHENLKKLFDELDPTGDGFIPASDLQGALEKAGKKQTTEAPPFALRPSARVAALSLSPARPNHTGRERRLEITWKA